MQAERYTFINKLYNELLKRKQIDPDKYEREDAFMGIVHDIDNGISEQVAFVKAFDLVHGIELSDAIYKSCYANVKGFKR